MWSKREVAEYLKVSVRQVDVLCHKHGLPFRKIGALVRFCPEDVERWVHSH